MDKSFLRQVAWAVLAFCGGLLVFWGSVSPEQAGANMLAWAQALGLDFWAREVPDGEHGLFLTRATQVMTIVGVLMVVGGLGGLIARLKHGKAPNA